MVTKKLVLTFLDEEGNTRKSVMTHFITDLDPRLLAEHLATLPGVDYAKNSKLNGTNLTHCIHAAYVVTRTYLLFKPAQRTPE